MMGLMNIVLLVFLFYYLTRITARTESTVKELFSSNDKIFDRWAVIVKDQSVCISLDVTKLMLDNMQKITETMLASQQNEIARMQRVLDDMAGRPPSGPPARSAPPDGPRLQSNESKPVELVPP